LAVIYSIRNFAIAAVISVGVVGTVYVGIYLPVEASAGKTTFISSTQNFLANIDAQVWLGWGAAASGALYGLYQKRKGIRERNERDERIAALEMQIDPNRSSSGLTPSGDAPKRVKKP